MVEVASYGRALAVDADGRAKRALLGAQELEPTWPGLHRYRIEMAFPAEWLAGMRYPLLIDPLIGNLLRLDAAQTQAGEQEKPAVAYNSVADEYLVVWQNDLTGDDDVYGQLVSGEGLLVGQNFTVTASAGSETVPDVAYNADADSYLVVWRDGIYTIKGQIISATGELSGTQLLIGFSMITSYFDHPAVAYSASAGRWLAVWQQWSGVNEYDIYARAVDAGGGLGTAFAVQSAAQDDVTPDVAANADGGYLVTWARENANATARFDVYARRVTTTSVDGAAFYVDGRGVSPAVAYDADDDQYLVAWQTQERYDAIRGRRVLGNREGQDECEAYQERSGWYRNGDWDIYGVPVQLERVIEYQYDGLYRLTRVVQDGVTYTFTYNGTGDRLSQVVGTAVTTYTLDLYGGLTQVLGDGASVYLYGLGRVGEEGAAGWLYHKGEITGNLGLGSLSAVIDWFEQGGCQSCGSDSKRWGFLRLLLDADYGDTISGIPLEMFGQQGETRLGQFVPLQRGCGIAVSGSAGGNVAPES